MRLFPKVDGRLDRYDRAAYITPPFDASLLTAYAGDGTARPVGTRGDALRVTVSGVESPSLRVVGTMPGVLITVAAGRNGPGVGHLRSTGASGEYLAWKAPGSDTYGTPACIDADGSYILEDGEDRCKWLRVTVWTAYLVSGSEREVRLSDRYGNGIASDDLTSGEATAGNVETVELGVKNVSGVIVSGVVAWFENTDRLQLSTDDLTYYKPRAEFEARALGDIAAGATLTLYVKRTIAAGADADPDVLSHLCLRFDAL